MNVTVIGSGSWGTALAQTAADNKHNVIVYGVEETEVNDINTNHKNTKYFGEEVNVNPSVHATLNMEEAFATHQPDVVILAVPSFVISDMCKQIDKLLTKKTIIVNVAKGFNPGTDERLSVAIRKAVSPEHLSSVVSLIGPSHAEEVILRQLTAVCAVSQSFEDAKTIQELFSNEAFRVYIGTDEVGSEIGVAVKNVLALASGLSAGLGYGDNTRAALITRGLTEMIRFGTAFGGQEKTFMGLTGVGDLIVTCSSVHSRNFQAGYEMGKANSSADFLAHNTKTVEGIRTAKIVHELATEKGIEMPICEEVYKVVYEGKQPSICIRELMLRDLKAE
jgi:glycerol-3-phosphate dehydrogenase (NAD(P)+)